MIPLRIGTNRTLPDCQNIDPSGLGPLGISNYKTPPDSDPSDFVESRPLRIRTPLTLKNFDPSGLGGLSSVKVAFCSFLNFSLYPSGYVLRCFYAV